MVILHSSHEKELYQEVNQGIAALLRDNPRTTMQDALWKVASDMRANNPFCPPKKGCPVNNLPTELLAHIFYLGTDTQEEEVEEEDCEDDELNLLGEEDEVDDGEEGKDGEEGEEEGPKASDRDIPDEYDEDDYDDDAELPFQVLVSHVCKHWRDVAVESPALWTTITFTEGAPFEKSRIWIERSKGRPLDINIDCTIPADGDPDANPDEDKSDEEASEEEESKEPPPFFSKDDLSTILDIITPHVERWRTLEVMVNIYEYVHNIMQRLVQCSSAPLLEILQLYHYEDCEEYDTFEPAHFKTPFLLFNGNAPNLTHVALWGVHLPWEESTFLSGLTDLELAYHAKDVRPSFEAFANILRSSPEIHTLTLCLSGPAGDFADWGGEMIELPSLKDLVLCYHEPSYIESLMRLISVPNVHSLALDYDEGDYSSFLRQLTRPLKGMKKSLLAGLEHLKISGLPCDHKSMDLMFEQLANLKSINLNCTGDETFFDKLMKPVPSSFLVATGKVSLYCPNLHTITTTGIEGAKMKQFVETRRAAGIPLTKVLMSEEDDVDIKEEKWLRDHLETLEFFEPSDSEEEVDIDEDDPDMDID